jgi:thiol-disulfide isomerase/thioredoxin
MLIGISDIGALKSDTSFSKWFNEEYETYHLNTKDLKELSGFDSTYSIIIVMGTWCSDSRREVPRFIKILDTLNYPVSKIKMIYVDREKKDMDGSVDSLYIKLVPTIIIYNEGKELGRIEEAPEETLEKDLIRITKKR